jgi:hypothetical protein
VAVNRTARWVELTALTALVSAGSLLASAHGALAQGDTTVDPSTRTTLLRTREAVWRAWFAGDSARFAKLVPRRLLAIDAADTAWHDWKAEWAMSRAFATAGGRVVALTFPRTEIQRFGDVAILFSVYTVETESGGKRESISGRATEVFVRRDGTWINPSWHLDSGR